MNYFARASFQNNKTIVVATFVVLCRHSCLLLSVLVCISAHENSLRLFLLLLRCVHFSGHEHEKTGEEEAIPFVISDVIFLPSFGRDQRFHFPGVRFCELSSGGCFTSLRTPHDEFLAQFLHAIPRDRDNIPERAYESRTAVV